MSSSSRPRGRQVSAAQAIGLLVSFVLVASLGGVVAAGLALPAVATVNTATNLTVTGFDELPTELDEQNLPEKSTILASDGTLLATFYAQNRVVVPLTAISVQLQHAVIATEDKRFYEHTGVDVTGMARAAVLSLLKPDSQQQGASTITQQYVKNVLIEAALNADTPAERQAGVAAATQSEGAEGYARKLREAKLAITLEQKETKDQILEKYLNIAPFGSSVYGAETAANHYFSKSAKDLTYLEAATIAGVTQNPSKYDPVAHPEASQGRRDTVLGLMHDQGFITDAEYTTGIATPLASTLVVSVVKQGCQVANDAVAGSAYFCDYVTKVMVGDVAFGASTAERQARLYKGGLTITTTLDPTLQTNADTQVKATVPVGDASGEIQAMSTVQPGTGQILTMAQSTDYVPTATGVAGQQSINYNAGYPYYSVNQGFQPGSTFKAFTLLTWLEAGHSLSETVNGGQSTFRFSDFTAPCTKLSGGTFTVANSEGSGAMMTVLDATRNSVNRAFMSMATHLDLCQIMQNAADLGVTNAKSGGNFKPVPIDVLGTDNTTPLAMAGAFATFASGGVYCKPIAILKVTDANGKELAIPSADCHQAIEADVANTMNYAMSKVWTGTMKSVGAPDFPAAGKTGTSNRNEYTWFVGYTPRLASAVVLANPSGAISPNYQVIGGKYYSVIYGSDIAGPTWKRFMVQALEGQDNPGFADPSDKLLNGEKVSVPSVIGSTVDVATTALKAAGFTAKVADAPVTSDVPAGLVATQSATKATAGSVITLTLSAGPGAVQPGQTGDIPVQGTGPGNGQAPGPPQNR
ncbi:MAG: transglycosylase domain-containing protein [Cellulomonas sp.]|nr:transglycosylase domain-containing protein [Cellulomonas sp.]